MMENSGKGALIDIASIPCPTGLDLLNWIISFQSFGFVLSVSPKLSKAVVDLFRERYIDAAVIGRVLDTKKITLKKGAETQTLFNFKNDKITGIVYR